MSTRPARDPVMERWIAAHRRDTGLLKWLSLSPPPPEWEGSKMEWAYTEMPVWNLSGREA